MFRLKDEYAFRLSNFLIIYLFNSFANCWFSETKSELISVKIYKQLKEVHVDIHHILDLKQY